VTGDVIGVVQALNKAKGKFTKDDLDLLEAMATQAAVARSLIRGARWRTAWRLAMSLFRPI
jgi:GAF domain-containing protein